MNDDLQARFLAWRTDAGWATARVWATLMILLAPRSGASLEDAATAGVLMLIPLAVAMVWAAGRWMDEHGDPYE